MIGLVQFRLSMRVSMQAAARLPGRMLASGLGVVVLVSPESGFAQSVVPSEVTPASLRPRSQPSGDGLILSGQAPLQPPADGGKFDVLIDHVAVEGTFQRFSAHTKRLVDSVAGRRLNITQIYAFATSLESAYAAAGYCFVRVTVPPQHIEDHGTLRLMVIDGFIESIDVRGVPGRLRKVIASSVAWLVGRRHVTRHEVERALLIASDLPGVSLRSALAPGTQEGGTRLIIEGVHQLLAGTFGMNDRLPASLGIWQLNGSMAVNSALGYGEQFYGSFGIGADLRRKFGGHPPFQLYGGGVVMPLGSHGVTINPEYTYTKSETLPGPGLIQSAGELQRYAVHLVDPLIRTRQTTLAFQVSLEQIEQRSYLLRPQANISLDRYTVIRFGPDSATTLGSNTGLEVRLTVSRGLHGRNAAKAMATGLPLSTFGAVSDFTKVGGNFHLNQALPQKLSLDVFGHVQHALGKPLLRAEQFSLNDSDEVSAFADSTYNVDQGATLRTELGRRFVFPAYQHAVSVTPYVFGAAGHGRLARATRLEQPVTNVATIGFGMHGALQGKAGLPGAILDVELARQFTDSPYTSQRWRANVNLMLSF